MQVVRRHSRATGTPRALLNVLASYADADTFVVEIGRAKLAEQSGMSRSTCRRAIRHLEDLGEVVTLFAGTGETASRYRLTLSTTGDNPGENVPDRGPTRRGRGVHSEPHTRVIDLSEGGGFPDHCPEHRHVEDPPPCRRCGKTRTDNATRRAGEARQAAAAQRDAARCGTCGKLEDTCLATRHLDDDHPFEPILPARLRDNTPPGRVRSGMTRKDSPDANT